MSALIVVSGAPAAGKSTVARALRDAPGWPLLAKDEFKELLFATLGWQDSAWSKQMSGAAYALMFATAKELLRANQNCLIEGNFRWDERQVDFAALVESCAVRMLQVFVTAEPDVLARRFAARAQTRHPGHADAVRAAEMLREIYAATARPLPLACDSLELRTDADNFAAFDAFIARVQQWERSTRSA
jgi:predicted kinase